MRRHWFWIVIPVLMAIAFFWWRGFFVSEVPRPALHEEKILNQKASPELPLQEGEKVRRQLLAAITSTQTHAFPAGLPWSPLFEIGNRDLITQENLLRTSPISYLRLCLERSEREVQGYRVTFDKQERIQGTLQPREVVDVHFRENPFRVHFHWLEGTRLAKKVLYVAGENQGLMKVRPAGLLAIAGIVDRPVDGPDAKRTGRYGIHEFGIIQAMRRTLQSMGAASERGKLFLEYHGMVKLKQVGDRPCQKFVRKPYDPVEEEGVNELTIYVDPENGLQVGSVLRDAKGNLIAEYFFRDLILNPTFPADQFSAKGL